MSDDPVAVCELCGKPMPEGEGMFRYHGYSGPCPGPHEDAASDPVAAALAWCNQPLMVVGDSKLLNALAVARMHAANLAAEVRRLQSNQTMQVGLLEACEDLGVQLEAAKRRQQQAEADRDSAVALYGVERADRQQAEAEVRRLHAEVANWQRKELIRGSCCADNEQRALQAEAALAAERIENAHLREAFRTMEKAYNANEVALAALKKHILRLPECALCGDAGWAWRHELGDETWDGSADDTQYTCPECLAIKALARREP